MSVEPTSTKRKASEEMTDAATSDDEMEQQLREHAVRAYNEFVRFFQRRSSMRIAANRVVIESHLRKRERLRMRYPMPMSTHHLLVTHNGEPVQTSELPTRMDARTRKTSKAEIRLTNETGTAVRRAVVLPRIPPVPTASMWTALSKNYDVEDEPQLKFLPYFGDDDEEDVVSEFYQIKLQGTSQTEVDFTKEMCEAVLRHLQLTWELTKPDLRLVAKTINVEEEVVMEINKRLKASPRTSKKSKKESAQPVANQKPEADGGASCHPPPRNSMAKHHEMYEKLVDSYRTLFCRRCYVYDCDYHGCRDVPKLEIAEQNAVFENTASKHAFVGMGRNCGNQCFLGQTHASNAKFSKARAISAEFGWDHGMRVACARAYFMFSGNFCDMARVLGNKTCLEVAEFCDFYDINDHAMPQTKKNRPAARRTSKKKKFRPSISHLQQIESGPMNAIPTVIVPCSHSGSCEDNNCSCFEDGRLCSKLCHCVHETCKIFFAGCRCLRGRCRTKACPCFAAGRECDPDLCTVCCAEAAAAMNAAMEARIAAVDADGNPIDGQVGGDRKGFRQNEPNRAIDQSREVKPEEPVASENARNTSCQNRNLGTGKRKQLRVGRSTMENAGWGLFVDDAVAKDEFIIEYIGEMVTQEEAERRGVVYDKLNRSYLFNLDTETVIDATRKGNKTRFINHSSTPNCYSKIININSDYRIGIYAIRDIAPHTELFFDYGYEKDLHHEHLHKTPTIMEWMKERPAKR